MKPLTKAEEQIMKVLWRMGKGLLMEVVEQMPEPKPHKNTVATLLKILTDKGFVSVTNVGRIHLYIPAVSQEHYSGASLTELVKGYFRGSYSSVVSFLVDKQKLSVEDMELLLEEMKKNKH